MLAQTVSSRFTSDGLSQSCCTITNVHSPETQWKQLEAYGFRCPPDMQHWFRDSLAQDLVLAHVYGRFQGVVRYCFISFYFTKACSAPFTIRLPFYLIFFKASHVKHKCISSTHQEGLVFLSSGSIWYHYSACYPAITSTWCPWHT